MTVNTDHAKTVTEFTRIYGDGHDGSAPTAAQWRHILARDPNQPITLVNLFKLKPDADDPTAALQALGRYSAVSMPAMATAGGSFGLTAPVDGVLIGDEAEWDMVAVGSYPNLGAFLALYQNPEYQRCFADRRAACAAQRVLITTA